MPSRIRFNDAGDVFAAFPELARYAPKPAGPVEALAYAWALAEARPPSAAIAYLAHLLPRREAIWWAAQCLGALQPASAQDPGARIATAWVRNPDEALRREAHGYSHTADLRQPSAWLARAVAHSGGSLVAPDQPAVAAPADACAQAVNAAIVVAASSAPPPMILAWFKACAEAGARFAAGEDAKVVAPPVSSRGSPRAAPPAA